MWIWVRYEATIACGYGLMVQGQFLVIVLLVAKTHVLQIIIIISKIAYVID